MNDKHPDLFEEARKRDEVLDALEVSRSDLIDAAKAIAIELAIRNGTVNSSQVLHELKTRGIYDGKADPRFMGGCFRKGWTRVGFETAGSHRRPISVWKLSIGGR